MDYIDAWNGAWPAFVIVFGGLDRIFGIWALLRYPNSSLTVLQWRCLTTSAPPRVCTCLTRS